MCTHCNDSHKNAQADTPMCSHCGCIDQPMHDVDGVLMCEDCADAEAHQCYRCGSYHHSLNDVYIQLPRRIGLNTVEWCDECVYCGATACDDCGELCANDLVRHAYTWDGFTLDLCPECLLDHYDICVDCGRYVNSYDVQPDDYGDPLCPNCVDAREADAGLLEYGHTYAHTMLRTPNDHLANFGLYLGCELEFATYDVRRLVDEAHATFGEHVECKKDCSVSGAELAFQPMSPRYIIDTGFSGKVQRIARECAAFADSSCGFHIHINRDFFGGHTAVYALVALIGAHPREWLAFSGRGSGEMREWAKIVVPDGFENFAMHGRSRYEAVTLTNRETVEIRLWSGQSDSRGIDAMIQATVGLALVATNGITRWIDGGSFDEIMEQPWEELVRDICAELDTHGIPSEAFRERVQRLTSVGIAA